MNEYLIVFSIIAVLGWGLKFNSGKAAKVEQDTEGSSQYWETFNSPEEKEECRLRIIRILEKASEGGNDG